jgi:uncharacterized heparinase superfamily protein
MIFRSSVQPMARLATVARRLRVMRARPLQAVRALVSHPEPQSIGSSARGRQLMAGNVLFAGALVAQTQTLIWDVAPPSPAFARALHGFEWLEDLAAVGDRDARHLAQRWTLEWIARFGTGRGPGWTPALTGRRMIRMITHAPFLLNTLPPKAQACLFRSLTRQALYLSREWPRGPRGLPRVEALTGLIYAGLTLEGMSALRTRAAEALADTVARDVLPDGGIDTRSPADLLEIFTLLGWVRAALRGAGADVPEPISAAMERIVPTLRALRHVNGALARFHGGGAGRSGQLDKALVTSGIREPATTGMAMGFATLAHGRTSMVIDAAPPPVGRMSGAGHASTLAFEMISGGLEVIANCGPGAHFGAAWTRASRATASHSTLSLERFSSARVGAVVATPDGPVAPLVQTPRKVMAQKTANRKASALILSHDGYVAGHGLTHLRRLVLSVDGRTLEGEDSLRALSRADKQQFDRALDATSLQGVPFNIRFHLHPDTDANLDLGGRAISILLPNEEVWVFRTVQRCDMALEPSVYLDPRRLKPRATKQIVLSQRLVKYAATIGWTLTKAQEARLTLDRA